MLAILLLVGLLTGCAHHSQSTATDQVHYEDCESLPFNSYARQECYDQQEGHHHANEVAGVFAYVIVRVVVEGIVHALIYR